MYKKNLKIGTFQVFKGLNVKYEAIFQPSSIHFLVVDVQHLPFGKVLNLKRTIKIA